MRDSHHLLTARRPLELVAFPALLIPVGICGVAGHTQSTSRIAAEIAVLALFVAVVGFVAAALAGLIGVTASLLSLNGFAEGEYGQLGWHPEVDLRAAAVLTSCWAVAFVARSVVNQRRTQHPRRRADP